MLVAVPAAEPVVGGLRARFDRSASRGMPAHITVVFPFLPATAAVVTELRSIIAAVPRFTVTLASVGWFGQRVVWLAPEPAGPLRELTRLVVDRFPGVRPYDGRFTEVVPHLTVGHDQPHRVLLDAAAEVEPQLPIDVPVSSVHLMASVAGGNWNTVATFELGC
ncbi:2'-5' RNA ligase family protein [Actinoplanes couchii]|uniref:2'-5' RNA ligase family protein n=1 Tax=Actinoplanes couchii TaxID=403638 RepID=UPI001EF1CEE3|nr:2'-5' RNA ligase family protein [Actinoplanes couchii]MDR6319240.1 2'-5' RNA ligase [Actinoplanes couchii]